MKMSYIQFKEEEKPLIAKVLGMETFPIQDPEQIDQKMRELKEKKYNTIVLSNELACFSEDIIQKYEKDEKMKIIILPSKNKE